MSYQSFAYTLLVLSGIIAYFIITDENAAAFFDIQFKWIGVNIRRRWMMMILGPRLRFESWKMKRWMKSEMPRIIKEQEEYKAQQASSNE